MHLADALISPAVGAAFYAASAGVAAYSVKKIGSSSDDSRTSLMGVMGAFAFAVQMLNFSIPGTGSSGHLSGGLLLAILLGAPRAFLVMGSILMVQSLFFADGGLLAFGCNWFNLGFIPAFVAYPFVWKPLASRGRYFAGAMVAAVAALVLGSSSIAVQTAVSGVAELPFLPFLTTIVLIHLVIGFAEGGATAAIVSFLKKARPELLSLGEPRSFPVRQLAIAIVLLALILGGFVSIYASSAPDGLEWSIEKVLKK